MYQTGYVPPVGICSYKIRKFEIDFIQYENTKSYMKVGNKIFLNVSLSNTCNIISLKRLSLFRMPCKKKKSVCVLIMWCPESLLVTFTMHVV